MTGPAGAKRTRPGSGLRRSELLNLRLQDVDSKRHLLIIRMSKGNRDITIPISDNVINMLRDYYLLYRPKIWLFEGATIGRQYSETSLEKIRSPFDEIF
ncbi:MAG: tyrosine-type recombinase/integrase [Candidatus Delongbacteria bacterium]|nr:tyrosine-type recombinase/integrase [Candidatus Delongbacteria bacterium]